MGVEEIEIRRHPTLLPANRFTRTPSQSGDSYLCWRMRIDHNADPVDPM